MNPQGGIDRFLFGLMVNRQSDFTSADLGKAIEIAGNYSPSAAFDRARTYWQRTHCNGEMIALAFAKGVRWLAMLRRDEGQAAFDVKCQELRNL